MTEEAPRYERKFVAEGYGVATLHSLIRRNPVGFWAVHPPRRVNNVYFDTPSLSFYRENASGIAHRTKVRLRWYGPLFGPVAEPVVEIKGRQALLGSKRRLPAPAFHMDRRLAGGRLAEALLSSANPELRRILLGLSPVLVTSYDRNYWLSRDGRFRLTLDSSIRYRRVHRLAIPGAESRADLGRLVVELKYDRSDDADAAQIVHHLPFRVDRNSKYARGIELLYFVSP